LNTFYVTSHALIFTTVYKKYAVGNLLFHPPLKYQSSEILLELSQTLSPAALPHFHPSLPGCHRLQLPVTYDALLLRVLKSKGGTEFTAVSGIRTIAQK
jgi:hypothetical protein